MLVPDLLVAVDGRELLVLSDEGEVRRLPEIGDRPVCHRGDLSVNFGHVLRSQTSDGFGGSATMVSVFEAQPMRTLDLLFYAVDYFGDIEPDEE